MKYLVISFYFLAFFSFSQEINHSHSIHHAFVENKGQWNKEILFKSKFQGGNLWVQQHKFLFHLADYSGLQKSHANSAFKGNPNEFKQDVVHLNFIGSNEIKSVRKGKPLESYYNYFLGNDKSKWQGNVRLYSEATLDNLYNGIHLKLIEENTVLKYEFHVQENIDPSQIKLEYAGQEKISINKAGNLILKTKNGVIQENKPYAYQIVNGKIKEISCEFVLNGTTVTFRIKNYNPNFKLIIDPVLVFATYSGSVTDNFGMTATYGQDETAYSAGTIFGNAYPTPDNAAFDINSNFTVVSFPNGTNPPSDVFISKYSQDGTAMLWTTFLGGGDDNQGAETAHSLICDQFNNVYIYGVTSSTDFPIQGGFQATHGGGEFLSVQYNGANFGAAGTDIYIAKISANGHSLLASTYMGGSGNDGANYNIFGSSGNYSAPSFYDSLSTNYGDQFRGEIMLDSLNNCLVASSTRSTNFPTQNPFQAANAGQQDGVIFKLNSNLSALMFSSYFGGSNNDACYSVKIDSSYNIVFAGGTSSTNLPQTVGTLQATFNGGIADGFIGKLNPSGSVLQRVTYLGTGNYDQVFFVEIDRNDKIFVIGQSRGGTFPVINAAFSNPNSGQFIAKIDENLSVIENSTVFGNGNTQVNISPAAFLVDVCGNIYVSGWGGSVLGGSPAVTGMQVTADAFQSTTDGFNFYLMVIERSFSSLKYATYLGGASAHEHVDGGTSRFDKNGIVYQSVCGGCGGFSDFPTSSGAWSSQNLSSNCNNIVFKFDFELVLDAKFTPSQVIGCSPFQVQFQNTSLAADTYLWDFGNGDTSTVIFNPTITFDSVGVFEVVLITKDSICLLSDTAKISITVGPNLVYTISNDTLMCQSNFIDLMASCFGNATTYQWSSNINFSDTLNTNLQDSVLTVFPENQSQTYYVKMSNSICSKIDSVQISLTSAGLSLTGGGLVCENDDFIVNAQNNSGLTYTYSWYPSNLIKAQLSPTSVSAVTTQPDYLFVDVTTSSGCAFTDSILINVSQVNSLSINASASQTVIIPGTQIDLSASPNGNFTYQWSPAAGLGNPSGQQTSATVNQTTTFTVLVTDGVCTALDSITILCVTTECKPPYVYVPNAFSPNEKDKNELFCVRGPQIVNMLLRVYDRWGELVFESKEVNSCWDGTFKGKKLDPDVYDYYLEVTCVAGNKELIKGNVTILK